jgi:hypothetical protein
MATHRKRVHPREQARDIGQEILDGIREIKQEEAGRTVIYSAAVTTTEGGAGEVATSTCACDKITSAPQRRKA